MNIQTGSDWIVWAVFAILVAISAVLLSGHGANLIAGYNTASKEEKEKYDEKKLGRVMGAGLLVIAFFLPFVLLGQALFPSWLPYAYLVLVLVDSGIMILLANTICRKKDDNR